MRTSFLFDIKPPGHIMNNTDEQTTREVLPAKVQAAEELQRLADNSRVLQEENTKLTQMLALSNELVKSLQAELEETKGERAGLVVVCKELRRDLAEVQASRDDLRDELAHLLDKQL